MLGPLGVPLWLGFMAFLVNIRKALKPKPTEGFHSTLAHLLEFYGLGVYSEYTYIYIYMILYKHLYIYIYVYIYIYTNACMYVCMYVCMHVCRDILVSWEFLVAPC